MPLARSAFTDFLNALRTGSALHADVDVFPALDDDAIGSFDPSDHGRGQAFLAWSKTADAAFDGDQLTQPLALHFGGQATRWQLALAQASLLARVDVDGDGDGELIHPLYGNTGTIVIAPEPLTSTSTDLARVLAAFQSIEADLHMIALPCTAFTQSDGWSDVAERADSAKQPAVFWTDQGHEAFDALGMLAHPRALHLYWRGGAETFARVLREHGLSVVEPRDEHTSIQVSSLQKAPWLPRFAELVPNEPRPGSRAADVARRGGGAFVVELATRSPERKPVRWLALSPSGALLALGHRDDLRGFPERSVIVLDARDGAVVAAPQRREWASPGCRGLAFLDDKRLAVCWTDYLPRSAWTQRTPPAPSAAAPAAKKLGGRRIVSRAPPAAPAAAADDKSICAVLELIELGDGVVDGRRALRFRELRVFGVQPAVRALALDRARGLLAVASPDGVVVVDEHGSEHACLGGPPLDTYPALALSRDGTRLAWSSDAGPRIRVVNASAGGAGGGVLCDITDALVHHGGRGFYDLAFSRDGALLAAGCRRYRPGSADGAADEYEWSVELFDVRAPAPGQRVRSLEGALRGATCFAFHPHADVVVAGGADGHAWLVELRGEQARERGRAPLLDGMLTCIAFSDDGARFVAADADGRVCAGRFSP